jgi:PucR C-terminal helix-turn-helix domain
MQMSADLLAKPAPLRVSTAPELVRGREHRREYLDAAPSLSAGLLALTRAVADADAAAFVRGAAEVAGAPVALVDEEDELIASSLQSAARRVRLASRRAWPGWSNLPLRDGAQRWGTVWLACDPVDLRDLAEVIQDLGLSLVRSIAAARARRDLESRLVVLGCLLDEDVEQAVWHEAPVPRARRMIAVHGRSRLPRVERAHLLDRFLRAAAEQPLVCGLSMVPADDGLIGVYLDTGSPCGRHHRAWGSVLRSADPTGRLTITVGAAVSATGQFRDQLRLLGQVSRVQQSRSRYFDLPRVALLDDLGPLTGVLLSTPGEQLVPYIERILGDLLADQRFGGQLIETLYAYMQTGGSPREAGELLHLHASTVKYRMKVIRELLGERLENRSTRFDLELAVRMCLAARFLRAKEAP